MPAFSKRVLHLLPVLIPLAVCLATGFYGLDLGHHWDEPYNVDLVSKAIRSGVLLPRYYAYPMVMFWMILAAIVPTIPEALQTSLSIPDYVYTDAFLLQARGFFLIVSALCVVWVYLLVLQWRKSWLEALLAASLVGFSWEFNYHIRWVAPDGPMTMFGALTLLCIVTAFVRSEHRWQWLKLAAIAAGLTVGSKYPAGLIIVPLVLALYFLRDANNLIVRAGKLIGLMAGSYLITTPATLLDPIVFVLSLQDMISQYSGGHEVHAIGRGIEHLGRIVQYFGAVALSPVAPIALVLAGAALIGVYATFRENRKLGIVLISFPVIYLLYFSSQQTMIIRNYLIVLPVLAIFSARGVGHLIRLLRVDWMRYAAGGVAAVLVVINAGWLVYAAQTIVDRETGRFSGELSEYIAAQPETEFYVTARVGDEIDDYANLAASPDEADMVVFYGVADGIHCIPANRPELILRWFGPLEINYDYYTTWQEERVVLMRANAARPYIDCITD